jgi:hypothetical protein
LAPVESWGIFQVLMVFEMLNGYSHRKTPNKWCGTFPDYLSITICLTLMHPSNVPKVWFAQWGVFTSSFGTEICPGKAAGHYPIML